MRLTNIDGPWQTIVVPLLITICAANVAHAETHSWKKGNSGNWFDAANWNTGKAPAAGDDVVIEGKGSRVTLGQITPELKSIRLKQTLVLTGGETILRARQIHVLAGGKITLLDSFQEKKDASRIYIKCSDSLIIDSGGSIDANAKGYAGGQGHQKNDDPTSAGFGPGAGGYPKVWGASAGGSHGGRGGTPIAKDSYGSIEQPSQPGSGGGGGTGPSGAGGGAIRIEAPTVHVDGVISADGGHGGGHDIKAKYGGGGSGGSIWITCKTITGQSGKVSADGGSGSIYAGGGGGGRVSIETGATRRDAKSGNILFTAVGGANGRGLFGTEKPDHFGEPGTLYFSSGSVPGRVFPDAGVVVQPGQIPQTERKETRAYWMPWLVNQPLVQVKKELFLKHSKPRAAARVTMQYVGPGLERREVRSTEILDDVGENMTARWSMDNARSWSDPVAIGASNNVDYQGVNVWEGGGAMQYDPTSKRLVQVWLRQIKVGRIYHCFTYCRLSSDYGRTWSAPRQMRYEEGDAFDPEDPRKATFLNHNEGYFGTNILVHSSGALIHVLAHTNASGDPKNNQRPFRMGSMIMIGHWDADKKQYRWIPGARLEVSPEISARGLMEPEVAELNDGRLLVVWRGSTHGWDGTVAKVPGHKWFSISTDGGKTLSPVREWKYSNGMSFFSSSSLHRMIRHSTTGKLYWLGNISGAPSRGNGPRYPLIIAEIDESAAAIKKESVTVIDDRNPNTHSFNFQLSNFSLFENRETRKFELFLTTYGQKKGHADWASADCYHYILTFQN